MLIEKYNTPHYLHQDNINAVQKLVDGGIWVVIWVNFTDYMYLRLFMRYNF